MGRLIRFVGAALLLGGCDGGITVHGVVRDESSSPVVGACAHLGDRVFDEDLNAYLDGVATEIGCGVHTDEHGRFEATRVLAGDGEHDVWIVIRKQGFGDYTQRVWKGDGFPEDELEVEITLLAP